MTSENSNCAYNDKHLHWLSLPDRVPAGLPELVRLPFPRQGIRLKISKIRNLSGVNTTKNDRTFLKPMIREIGNFKERNRWSQALLRGLKQRQKAAGYTPETAMTEKTIGAF